MKTIVISIFVGCFFLNASAQIQAQDSTQVENLEEVLIKNVRVKADSPITHSNLDKEDLATRNLGQDIPMMLNYLPSVVTSSDAGAGVG